MFYKIEFKICTFISPYAQTLKAQRILIFFDFQVVTRTIPLENQNPSYPTKNTPLPIGVIRLFYPLY